jgi:hypothetical protein
LAQAFEQNFGSPEAASPGSICAATGSRVILFIATFRADVVSRDALRSHANAFVIVLWFFLGQPQVDYNACASFDIEQEVGWLDVPMNNPLFVDKSQALQKFTHVLSYSTHG